MRHLRYFFSILAAAACFTDMFALPSDSLVCFGEVGFVAQTEQLDVFVKGNAIIDWNDFSIAQNETVKFNQFPDSKVLNRVTGDYASKIEGNLFSQGQLYLINSNGIIISKEGVVDVGRFVASTHQITDESFLSGGELLFNGSSEAAIENFGVIRTSGGGVLIVAQKIANDGLIESKGQKIALVAADEVLYKPNEKQPLYVLLTKERTASLIENRGSINSLSDFTIEKKEGKIIIGANQKGLLFNQGELKSDQVIVEVGDHFSSGKIEAGQINILVEKHIEMSSSHIKANRVEIEGKKQVFTSGLIEGGRIELCGELIKIAGATLDASGTIGGGVISIGGTSSQTGAECKEIIVNHSSQILANATRKGSGGNITLFSKENTICDGKIFAEGVDKGGFIEISSTNSVCIRSEQSVRSLNGLPGEIFIDPLDINVTTDGNYPAFELLNPNPGEPFGSSIFALTNGNIIVGESNATIGGIVNAGAIYFFNGATGELISTLVGSSVNDYIGFFIGPELQNGNFWTSDWRWSNERGMLAIGDKNLGISGVAGPSICLCGSTPGDDVGLPGLEELSDTRFAAVSYNWNNTAASAPLAGAVTIGNTSNGVVGYVSSANSFVGSNSNDRIGLYGVYSINQTYGLILVPLWNSQRGAVTWFDIDTGITGTLSASNSLVGSNPGDEVGLYGFRSLSNNNYIIATPNWNGQRGAVTWCDGQTGAVGEVSALNSLTGSTPGDQVGLANSSSGSLLGLANGNYVVLSSYWNGGLGAITWCDGSTGFIGTVSTANSLCGSQPGDYVGEGSSVALSNGNYAVSSKLWSNGSTIAAGAVTFCDGTTPLSGTVSTLNSLVGVNTGDLVGNSLIPVGNNNFVVESYFWNNNRGAVTWVNGTVGIIGTVSSLNSLVGSDPGDQIGIQGILTVSDGNYVVSSPDWNQQRGALTWASGGGGIVGTVSSANSLVGSDPADQVGSGGVFVLESGNYIAVSPAWNEYRGSITWANGNTGIVGTIQSANSLVGENANDFDGGFNTIDLSNGNFVVGLQNWGEGRGAVALINGTKPTTGFINANTCLVGGFPGDYIGSGFLNLFNGNFVTFTSTWNDNRGAVTWVNGEKGLTGTVSSSNSLVGQTPGDFISDDDVGLVGDNKYFFTSKDFSYGPQTGIGAATWCDASKASTGYISYANSYIGVSGGTGFIKYANRGGETVAFCRTESPSKIYLGINDPSNIKSVYGLNQNMNIHPDSISAALQSQGNVTLQAINNITINAEISTPVPANLTLDAGKDVTINQMIYLSGGKLIIHAENVYYNFLEQYKSEATYISGVQTYSQFISLVDLYAPGLIGQNLRGFKKKIDRTKFTSEL